MSFSCPALVCSKVPKGAACFPGASSSLCWIEDSPSPPYPDGKKEIKGSNGPGLEGGSMQEGQEAG